MVNLPGRCWVSHALTLLVLFLSQVTAGFGDAEGSTQRLQANFLTLEVLTDLFQKRFKGRPKPTEFDLDLLSEFLEEHKQEMIDAHTRDGRFDCKLPVIGKESVTRHEFNQRFLKPRVPVLIRNAAAPRDIRWFSDQKCLGFATIHNLVHAKRADFWAFYKDKVDANHDMESVRINAGKYLVWLNKNYEVLAQSNQGFEKLGVIPKRGVAYNFELRYMLSCPNLVKEWAPPVFMRDNWGHALHTACSEIEGLPGEEAPRPGSIHALTDVYTWILTTTRYGNWTKRHGLFLPFGQPARRDLLVAALWQEAMGHWRLLRSGRREPQLDLPAVSQTLLPLARDICSHSHLLVLASCPCSHSTVSILPARSFTSPVNICTVRAILSFRSLRRVTGSRGLLCRTYGLTQSQRNQNSVRASFETEIV
jgi:hypothetical protein